MTIEQRLSDIADQIGRTYGENERGASIEGATEDNWNQQAAEFVLREALRSEIGRDPWDELDPDQQDALVRVAVEAARSGWVGGDEDEKRATELLQEQLEEDASSVTEEQVLAAIEEDEDHPAVQEGREALIENKVWRTWKMSEDGNEFDEDIARSLQEALDNAEGAIDRGNYDAQNSTFWVDVSVECPATGESGHRTVAVDPEEPECVDSDGHDWQSPHRLVGGIEDNPGVWGNGGGVVIHECCMRCGTRKITDTWAQNPDGGEQGLTSVEYEEGYYDLSDEEDDDEEDDE